MATVQRRKKNPAKRAMAVTGAKFGISCNDSLSPTPADIRNTKANASNFENRFMEKFAPD
jgi:hypothetical protein